ncbi:unnamed protein product [Rhizopus stolonifer]
MKNAGSPFTSLEPDVCIVIDSIIKADKSGEHKLYSMEDMNGLLEQIQTKKAECSKNKQRDTQLYQALSYMEEILRTKYIYMSRLYFFTPRNNHIKRRRLLTEDEEDDCIDPDNDINATI